jgi:hypothetical protein
MGEKINAYKILVGKPEGKIQFGRSGRKWDDTKMDFNESGCDGVDWVYVAPDMDQWRESS